MFPYIDLLKGSHPDFLILNSTLLIVEIRHDTLELVYTYQLVLANCLYRVLTTVNNDSLKENAVLCERLFEHRIGSVVIHHKCRTAFRRKEVRPSTTYFNLCTKIAIRTWQYNEHSRALNIGKVSVDV